jgi:hypothetical protein
LIIEDLDKCFTVTIAFVFEDKRSREAPLCSGAGRGASDDGNVGKGSGDGN